MAEIDRCAHCLTVCDKTRMVGDDFARYCSRECRDADQSTRHPRFTGFSHGDPRTSAVRPTATRSGGPSR